MSVRRVDSTSKGIEDRLSQLMNDLELNPGRKGVTLSDRIDLIVTSLKEGVDQEFDVLSVSGFKELVESLADTTPTVYVRLRKEFEIEDNDHLDTDRLRALGISPLDILNTYSNEEVVALRDKLGLSKKEKPRTAILQSFANANSKLVDQRRASRSQGTNSSSLLQTVATVFVAIPSMTNPAIENLSRRVSQ